MGAPAGRSRIITLKSLRALVGTPRQGHTKVGKQFGAEFQPGLLLCVTCPMGRGCTAVFSVGPSSPFPKPSWISAQGSPC